MKSLLSLLVFISFSAPAQTTDSDFLFNLGDPENTSEEYGENLYHYYQNPVNINKATRDEMQALNLLSDIQIEAILSHIRKYGRIVSLSELQVIPGFNAETIRKIKPFISIEVPQNGSQGFLKKFVTNKNQYAFIRNERTAELKKGYASEENLSNGYLGSPWKLAGRYKNTRFGDFSTAVSFEKDPGEKTVWNRKQQQYGFDFYSFHLAKFNIKRVRGFCIGDYTMQFGQGLILGSGITLGKGAETIATTRRNNTGIRPFSSFSEGGFFRGGALIYSLTKRIDITLLYSRKNIDAAVDSIGAGSFMTSGYHRTDREKQTKKTVLENVSGTRLSYHTLNNTVQIGINSLYAQFNHHFKSHADPYKIYQFKGNKNFLVSIDYAYYWKNISVFGEMARSTSNGWATTHGVITSLSSHLDFSLLYRNYNKNFVSFYGNAFAENTSLNNEEALYQGIKIKPGKKLELSGYYDLFSFPWLKYQVNGPSRGYEYFLRINYTFAKKAYLFAQYKQELKEKNTSNNNENMHWLESNTKQVFTAGMSATYGAITLSSRYITSQYKKGDSLTKGNTFLLDLNLNLKRFDIGTRFALFDTDDYNNRHYVYEKDLLYAFYIPAYSGKGIRTYLISRLTMHKHLDLWIKVGRTIYENKLTISSGNEEISGNRKTDFKLQLRLNI